MEKEALSEVFHIDRSVADDMAGALVMAMASAPDVHLTYTHRTDGGIYCFSSDEVREVLGPVSLAQAPVMRAVEEMIRTNLEAIGAEGETPLALLMRRPDQRA